MLLFMIFAKFFFLPALSVENKLGHADCLLAVGTKA